MSTKLTYTGAEVQELLDKVKSGGSGGGEASYDRLDAWADYSADKAGYVLSAALGFDMNTRLTSVENAGYVTASALAPYILRSEVEGQYLSKNGGTMVKGAGIFNEADPSAAYGAIGFNSNHNAFGSPFFPTKLRSSSDVTLMKSSGEFTLLHTGNYSTLLAGGMVNGSITATSFIGEADRALALSDYYGRRVSSANIVFADTRVRKLIATSAMTTAKPPTDGSILHFAWDNATGWNHQLFIACGGDTAPDQRMAWRGQRISEAWADWKPIAFIDGNVASATKLATPRLIWGQSFDGTQDVTGALTAPSITTNSLTIGGATITYDSVNEALCINGNMYALGGVTAGGAGISAYTSLEARVARIEQQLNIS